MFTHGEDLKHIPRIRHKTPRSEHGELMCGITFNEMMINIVVKELDFNYSDQVSSSYRMFEFVALNISLCWFVMCLFDCSIISKSLYIAITYLSTCTQVLAHFVVACLAAHRY